MVFSDYIKSIEEFYRDNDVIIDPLPRVILDKKDQNKLDPFIQTGFYRADQNCITLFIANRHLKDILRSFCHELIHHNQHLVGADAFDSIDKSGSLIENDELSRLEGDAYLRGNMLFRQWTEQFTK